MAFPNQNLIGRISRVAFGVMVIQSLHSSQHMNVFSSISPSAFCSVILLVLLV